MNKRISLALLAALLVLFGACQKEEVNPDPNPHDTTPVEPKPAPNEQFVGDYSLAISFVTYMDDVLQEETGTWSGSLTIQSDGTRDGVTMSGNVLLNGNTVELYNTTGVVDSVSNTLTFASSQFSNAANGVTFTIAYTSFGYSEPLVFSSQLNTSLQGYQIRYELTNTANRVE